VRADKTVARWKAHAQPSRGSACRADGREASGSLILLKGLQRTLRHQRLRAEHRISHDRAPPRRRGAVVAVGEGDDASDRGRRGRQRRPTTRSFVSLGVNALTAKDRKEHEVGAREPLIAKMLGDVHVQYARPRGLPCRSNRYCAPARHERHILPNRAFVQDRR
jgi:hypothetical protein